MGVPALYRWLVEKYPLAAEVVEEPIVIDGVKTSTDSSAQISKYDNLYLDITAILYLSLHPQDRHSPYSCNEVLEGLFDYIDHIFALVHPQKLVYMAFDGVAPRAKMNEQRCRRFRAAKDAADSAAEEEKLCREFERQGRKLPSKNYRGDYFSHLIAPGTQFMETVSMALKYYIHLKLNYDTEWKKVIVILSDANVPGEGEHKIMSYIRLQRNLPGYDPNTCHCVYGLDADLVMLALATHEVHFSILRNLVPTDCIGKEKEITREGQVVGARKQYQFLHVWRLREYLEYEMRIPDVDFRIDFERFVDDFILMCFFLGNDFLPRMPTLEIREDAINLMLVVYKREFMALGEYLTDSSRPNLKSVEHFIQVVGSYEDNIFKKRAQLTRRQVGEAIRGKAQTTEHVTQPTATDASPSIQSTYLLAQCGMIIGSENSPKSDIYRNKNDLKKKLKELLREKSDTFSLERLEEDKVKLGEPGWKRRYYEQKFSARTHEEVHAVRKDVVAKYIEGLCWVTHYYFEGVCSWKWFYPYHYAPFASDLKDLEQLNISFELGAPFKPFTQMLGISPATNSRALPKEYRKLIIDPNSPIIDLYPTDFEVDTNGKRYTWQGVVKLPFIDEDRILTEVAKVEPTLTHEEVQRNSVTHEILFVSLAHKLCPYLASLRLLITDQGEGNILERLDPEASFGINGYISISIGKASTQTFRSPIEGKEDIVNDQVIYTGYRLPDAHKHIARPHMGVIFPERTVTIKDVKSKPLLWHEEDSRISLENNGQNQPQQECMTKSTDDGRHRQSRQVQFMEKGRQSHQPMTSLGLPVESLDLKAYQPDNYYWSYQPHQPVNYYQPYQPVNYYQPRQPISYCYPTCMIQPC